MIVITILFFCFFSTEGLEVCALQEFLSCSRQLFNLNHWIVIFVAQELSEFRYLINTLLHFESNEFVVEIFSLDNRNSSLVLKCILDKFSEDRVQHERHDINFLLLDSRHLFRVKFSYIDLLELSYFLSKSVHDPDAFVV